MKDKTYGRKLVKGNIKKSDYKKRLYSSWYICILVGVIVGMLIGVGIVCLGKNKTKVEFTESATYGTIDNRVFKGEMFLDWNRAESLGFVPLDVPMDEEMQEFIYCLCYGYNIDFSLVMAVIEHESSFRSNIVSDTGDYGLMQINEINHGWLAERFDVTDFTDPYQNTRCGIYILRKLFEKYEEPEEVLMAYNMGSAGASKLWEQGIYETDYSNSIMEKAAKYREEINK